MEPDERDFILESAQRLEEWENTPRDFDDPYCDMTREELSKLASYQQELLAKKEKEVAELNSKLDMLIESQSANQASMNAMTVSMAEMASELKELRISNKAKDILIEDLKQTLLQRNNELYGEKSKKSKSTKHAEPKSRQKDKDDFDGTPDSINPDATIDKANEDDSTAKPQRTEAQLRADILRAGSTYRRMNADKKVLHLSDMSKLPKGAVVIKKISQYAYEQKLEITEHQYELIVYKLDGKFFRVYLPADGEIQYVDKIPGIKASSEMLANLAIGRYLLDTPNHRELKRLNDEGMDVCEKTLTNWLYKGSELLKPIVDELKKVVLKKDAVVNCDETWCRVKVLDKYRKRYIWCIVNKETKVAMYFYEDGSRSRDALKEILDDADIMALQSDGYNVYLYLEDKMSNIEHLCCLAHSRNRFKDAADIAKDPDAIEILALIAKLYAFEKTYREMGLTPEQIGKARKSTNSLEIVGLIRSKLDVLLSDDHPPRGELMEKAVRYMDTFWKQLFRYLENGRYSIDNNIAERYIRPLTGERKNILHFGSHKMAKASAIYHTVITTCKMMSISASEYLKFFFRKIVEGETDYSKLMPQTIGINAKNY